MKVVSLYDGISCGRVALEELGFNVTDYEAYEIEDYAVEVSKHNWENINHHGDVFKADFTQFEGYDLVMGGSPCTYWSIAKGGQGRETVSSGIGWELFSQFVRAVNEVKPRYFLYENNESMSNNIKEEITKALGVQPVMIDSADFSPQVRKRLYWTNIPLGKLPDKSKAVFQDVLYTGEEHIVRDFGKYESSMRVDGDGSVRWDTSGKGFYSQQNRARVPNVKMSTVVASGTDKNNVYLGGTNYRKLHPVEAERLQGLPDNYTSVLKSKTKRLGGVGNGWTVPVIKYLMSGMQEDTN